MKGVWTILDYSRKLVEQYDQSCHVERLQTSPSIPKLNHPFIDNYKDATISGLRYLLEYNLLVLFMKTQFSIWIWDSIPAGIWKQLQKSTSYTPLPSFVMFIIIVIKLAFKEKFINLQSKCCLIKKLKDMEIGHDQLA